MLQTAFSKPLQTLPFIRRCKWLGDHDSALRMEDEPPPQKHQMKQLE